MFGRAPDGGLIGSYVGLVRICTACLDFMQMCFDHIVVIQCEFVILFDIALAANDSKRT